MSDHDAVERLITIAWRAQLSAFTVAGVSTTHAKTPTVTGIDGVAPVCSGNRRRPF
jgi:hypothetical protein